MITNKRKTNGPIKTSAPPIDEYHTKTLEQRLELCKKLTQERNKLRQEQTLKTKSKTKGPIKTPGIEINSDGTCSYHTTELLDSSSSKNIGL